MFSSDISDGNTIGFASQLRLLVKALEMSLEAQYMEDFLSVTEAQVGSSLDENKSSRAIKGSPLDSLFGQFCLHALWFGNCNIRAIAVLWIEFVREVRWCWEESHALPRMSSDGAIDLSTCLINQKLHMQNMQIQTKFSASLGACEGFGNNDRKSSSRVAGSMMLLKSYNIIQAPITQSFSAQLEKDILASDMSAFKAANPDAVFEDFIRWHSPKDWESDCSEKLEESRTYSEEESAYEWPPRGRLSERMSDIGNSWRKIWNEALPLPASEQKPLLDPNREGEKVLHYLETLRPHQLLSQMVSTAFRAAADILNQTSFGGLKQMTTKMGQLYITMASILKYMQSYNTTSDSEVIEDLSRLCVTFEHIEKLILLAASLHCKFLQSPHLVEAIFSDYYDYYLQEMGTGSSQGDKRKEFDKPQEIQSQDRKVIAGMFTPPTAAQSWRKVKSMGNLLNGHEPYEALIQRSQTAWEGGVKQLDVYTDSQLVTMQVQGSYETKEWSMTQYLKKVKEMMKKFDKCQLHQILRDENVRANALSKFGAMSKMRRTNKCESCQKFAGLLHAPATPLKAWGINIVRPFSQAATPRKFLSCLSNTSQNGVLISENGAQFQGKKITAWCKELTIQQNYTVVGNPQANGQVEVTNRILLQHLKKRLEGAKGSWVEKLPRVLWVHRPTPRLATGETPFFLVYETEAIIPAEIEEETVRVRQYDPQDNT
ncbi:UNVERIFIED_CONTAM: Rab3 GTPase-activating protein catalytic subunit [Sesamum indicum]